MEESEGCDESRVLTSREKASKVDWKPRVDDLGLLSDSHVEVAVRSDKVRRPAPKKSAPLIQEPPIEGRARKGPRCKRKPSITSLGPPIQAPCCLSWQGPRIEGGSNTRGGAPSVSACPCILLGPERPVPPPHCRCLTASLPLPCCLCLTACLAAYAGVCGEVERLRQQL